MHTPIHPRRFVTVGVSHLATAVLLAACGGQVENTAKGTPSDSVVTVNAVPTVTVAAIAPASYVGTVACADCSGIRTTLAVFNDSTWRVQQLYEGKSTTPVVRMGRWRFDGSTLALDADTGTFLQLALVHADTLRLLDTQGKPIASATPLSLVRTDSMDRVTEAGTWVGSFMYQADAATFRECASGQTYAVLMKGGYRALERAYTAAKLAPGSGWQVEVTGRFVPRPENQEGHPDRDVLEVQRYLGPSANPNCR